MSATFVVDTSGLKRLAQRLNNPAVKTLIESVTHRQEIVALVAQAIADNFQQEGPGWAPLAASTIRSSVSQQVSGQKVSVGGKLKSLSEMTDAELLKYEAKARKNSASHPDQPFRRILRKSGMLMKSVTSPGAAHNLQKYDGTKLVWGTDLIYAGVHNAGNPGKGIPKREFLKIRKEWKDQIGLFMLQEITRILNESITRED